MVRLRSDRWYSRSGQRRSRLRQRPAGGGVRRVFSLAILLVLVVWVMQRSSDPLAYERIFRYLGVPLAASGIQVPGGDSSGVRSSGLRSSGARAFSDMGETSLAISPEASATKSVNSLWDRLPWTDKDLSRAVRLVFDQDRGIGVKTLSAQAADGDRAAKVAELPWSQPNIELAVQVAMTENIADFSYWLDTRLLSQLTDGSPWRSSETDVFYRLLQRSNQWDRAEADQLMVASYPAIKESVPLHRGKKWIRCRGWIEQAKRIEPKEAILGIHQYWTLWLRPSDQSAHPIVVYVTRLPPPLAGKAASEVRGEIEVFGLPAKLMAYNAVGGVEVAPALCGVASDYFVNETSSPPVASDTEVDSYAWVWPIVIASLFAVAWVTWIWRSSQVVERIEEPESTAESKKLKFKLGGQKSSTDAAKKLSLFMLCLSLFGSEVGLAVAHTSSDTVQEERSSDNDEVVVKTRQLLASRLSDEAIFDMRHYSANDPQGLNLFPNSMGRLMFTLGQLGEERLQLVLEHKDELNHWQVRLWTGWVVACDIVDLQQEQVEWMAQRQVYRLSVEVFRDEAKMEKGFLFVKQAPSQWLNQSELRQPFRAYVVDFTDRETSQVFGVDSESQGEQELNGESQQSVPNAVGVAANIQWVFHKNIDLLDLRPPLPNDWVRLALLGADLSWIDLARARQKLDLAFEDRSSFYQLLRIGKELGSVQGIQADGFNWADINGPELLARDSDQWVGHAISVKGRIARVSRVPIEQSSSQMLTNSDFYYELDGFIRIEGRRVVIPPPKSSSGEAPLANQRAEDLVYENEFPMTVVALELPEFLKSGEVDDRGVLHQSWSAQTWVDVQGLFYRNWSYRSEYVRRGNSRERQMAPLVIASKIRMTEVPTEKVDSPGNWVNWMALLMICALLTLIWGFVIADTRGNLGKRRKKITDQQSR